MRRQAQASQSTPFPPPGEPRLRLAALGDPTLIPPLSQGASKRLLPTAAQMSLTLTGAHAPTSEKTPKRGATEPATSSEALHSLAVPAVIPMLLAGDLGPQEMRLPRCPSLRKKLVSGTRAAQLPPACPFHAGCPHVPLLGTGARMSALSAVSSATATITWRSTPHAPTAVPLR